MKIWRLQTVTQSAEPLAIQRSLLPDAAEVESPQQRTAEGLKTWPRKTSRLPEAPSLRRASPPDEKAPLPNHSQPTAQPGARPPRSRWRLPITPRQAIVMAGLISAAAFCGTYAVAKWRELGGEPVRPYSEMKGQWIQATSASGMDVYTGVFRRELRLPGHVRNAWIAVAARDGFEVTVNGRAIGWQHMWRPTRPFQTGLSERGQWLEWPKVALSLNFAREYQWTDHQNYLLPVFIDLSPYLHVGKNVVGVSVESRQAPAKVRFDGVVTLFSGETISLASGVDWKAEVIPPYFQNIEWWSTNYAALNWRQAALTDAPPGQPLRAFHPGLFSTPFRGNWIRHPQANAQDSVWFQCDWQIDRQPDEAWLRLAANRNFELYVNGRRGYPQTPDDHGQDTGEWIYGHKRTGDQWLDPEQMFSHDVGDEFIAHQYIGPPQEPLGVDKHQYKTMADDPTRKSKLHDPDWAVETRTPLMLRHNASVGAYVGYNLTGMLRQGGNTIEVRLNRPATADPVNWLAQIAADGEITFHDGTRQALISDGTWKSRKSGSSSLPPELVDAQQIGPAQQSDQPLSKLQYRGSPTHIDFFPSWVGMAGTTTGAGLLAFAGFLFLGTAWPSRKGQTVGILSQSILNQGMNVVGDALLAFTAVLAGAIIVQAAFGERSEQMWFMLPSTWQWCIVAAVALGLLAAVVRVARLTGSRYLSTAPAIAGQWLRDLPNTRLWTIAVIAFCLLTFFTRAYRQEFQPLDYDENPSLLALQSVARTGIPSYVPEAVWYTRSPLYHYITGAFVWLLGENLWAARLPSILFSVGTALLLYLCGSRLLKRPWIGMAAMALTLIHPQMFMTGHMIRFYQQQQFFGLLTAYFFCKGFVTDQSQGYRYLTVVGFLAATLSQEITAVLAVPLAVGYLFFAGQKTIAENIKLLVGAGCALLVIIIDYLVYETHTMTRLEGFSTTMQADIGPHLWDPYNLVTVFLSYSRIHLPLTFMFLLGLPAALWERNRVVFALHLLLFGNIIMLNLMVTQVSVRYVYWLFPLLMLLALDNGRAGLAWLVSAIRGQQRRWTAPASEQHDHTNPLPVSSRVWGLERIIPGRQNFASMTCWSVLFVATIVSWSPWRLPGTYSTKLLADSNGSFQYIQSQLRPGDVIVVTQPHAKGALMEIGRVDYELHIPMVYDFVLRQDGRLVERGAGAGVIYSVEQFQKLCAEHQRVWIAIDREQYPFRGERIRFSHAGARMELFLRKNTEVMHRTHMWNVYLWDTNRGLYRSFRQYGT